ncbi:MAG: Pup ligase PafA' paralog, possible component of postulated heterodimer PafA-PafA' [uncultured Acidimicrobiales bacterium]|uniref:Pup ligase PafA' paralog, possible component of postulated heterodimer PafA-PafA n=1 Tax=uncultured Acidimicrobiales bacterium TaxID=310071 RepID=A0A6J4H7U0_9ACTN|nr:MAG: Pup ligase PafA' paralog, possible component of postulated heterodimer PafA-PafA' [uncultured Acidimicrobiales bacterium]
MALPKVYGIETEYGIRHTGVADPNPIAASSVLINAYLSELARRAEGTTKPERVGWDFEDEHPGDDARGFSREGALPPEVETHLVNAVLTNGARYYVDHAHPEYSSPECSDPLQGVLWDRAGERILVESMEAARRQLPPGQEIVVYKNNSDRKGNSYGCHENYLMDRAIPFGQIVKHVLPHFVTRQIWSGAGKVGCEAASTGGVEVPFQLTQRADFFEEEVGLETTLKRPIINTRDEPHADASRYRRLHVIIGDANRSEVQTFLKLGVMGFVLCMVEDDWFGEKDFTPANPVLALRQISYDLTLRKPFELVDGTTVTALDVQWEHLGLARKWADENGMGAVGGDLVGAEVLRRWEQVLTGLETDPMSLADQLDWVAKKKLLDAYRERDGLEWRHPKMAQLDLVYHDLRPGKSLADKLGLERLVTDAEVTGAVSSPPPTTRAWFRGRCLDRFPGQIAAANWDSMVFDLGGEPLKRVAMMEPLRGTEEIVGPVLEDCDDAGELLRRLGA